MANKCLNLVFETSVHLNTQNKITRKWSCSPQYILECI